MWQWQLLFSTSSFQMDWEAWGNLIGFFKFFLQAYYSCIKFTLSPFWKLVFFSGDQPYHVSRRPRASFSCLFICRRRLAWCNLVATAGCFFLLSKALGFTFLSEDSDPHYFSDEFLFCLWRKEQAVAAFHSFMENVRRQERLPSVKRRRLFKQKQEWGCPHRATCRAKPSWARKAIL